MLRNFNNIKLIIRQVRNAGFEIKKNIMVKMGWNNGLRQKEDTRRKAHKQLETNQGASMDLFQEYLRVF